MGYSRDYRGRLCCDRCGQGGGARKRTCPHTVLTDSTRGPRARLAYCYPPALCGPCYKAEGGLRGIHGQRCADGAATSQAEYDATEARLDAGEFQVLAAWGDWQDGVPEGRCGVLFGGRDGQVWKLVADGEYDPGPGRKPWLSDYPDATDWVDHA